MSRMFQATCRVCSQLVLQGGSCEHLHVNEYGQAYQVHSQHQFEPDPYAEVILEYPPEEKAALGTKKVPSTPVALVVDADVNTQE